MNFRLARPAVLIDINGLGEIAGVTGTPGDEIRIGAVTRYRALERDGDFLSACPLFADALPHIAHPAIRNRGTIGGSLAHADPASELPACMVALGATILVRNPRGERRIPAEAFFTGIYQTVLAPQELLVAVEVPVVREASAHFFHEFARRHGDYAIVGLAAQAIFEGSQFADLRLGFFAIGDRPLLAKAARKLVNVDVTPERLSDASAALGEELDPEEDHQASPTMRRYLAKVLLTRCVSTLLSRPDLRARGSA
jgi:carbon-monoxide dehydrogenase medium subunit